MPAVWFDRLACVLTLVKEDGIWLDGLLDAYTAMIPKTDGGFNTLKQRPPCPLPIAYRLWASVRLQHLQECLESLGS